MRIGGRPLLALTLGALVVPMMYVPVRSYMRLLPGVAADDARSAFAAHPPVTPAQTAHVSRILAGAWSPPAPWWPVQEYCWVWNRVQDDRSELVEHRHFVNWPVVAVTQTAIILVALLLYLLSVQSRVERLTAGRAKFKNPVG